MDTRKRKDQHLIREEAEIPQDKVAEILVCSTIASTSIYRSSSYACRFLFFISVLYSSLSSFLSVNLVNTCSFCNVNKRRCYDVNKRAHKLRKWDAISNLLFDSWSIQEQNRCVLNSNVTARNFQVLCSLLKFYPLRISRWKWNMGENFNVPLRIISFAYKFYLFYNLCLNIRLIYIYCLLYTCLLYTS